MGQILHIKPSEREAQHLSEWLRQRHADIADAALAARAEGRLLDLTAPLPEASQVEILTFDDEGAFS